MYYSKKLLTPNSWKIGIEKWDKLSTCGTFWMVQRPSYPFRGKKQAANVRMVIFEGLSLPIGSMGLVNVGNCTIHGSYGHGKSPRKKSSNCMVNLWNLPYSSTPRKINMEPWKSHVWKENHLNRTFIFRFHVNFRGSTLFGLLSYKKTPEGFRNSDHRFQNLLFSGCKSSVFGSENLSWRSRTERPVRYLTWN